MPRLTKAVPRYLKHKPSGQARVLISGQEIWLGKHNSPASLALYDQLLARWLAGGWQLDLDNLAADPPPVQADTKGPPD